MLSSSELPQNGLIGALRPAKENVDLTVLGIESSKVRCAASGGLLIETAGVGKINLLTDRLKAELPEGSVFCVPLRKRMR